MTPRGVRRTDPAPRQFENGLCRRRLEMGRLGTQSYQELSGQHCGCRSLPPAGRTEYPGDPVGDDGDETPLATVLPGLALYGLLRFGSAVPRQTDPFCRLFSDLPLAAYELMEKMDLIPGMPQENLEALIPHKLLLYGDMASELFQPVLTSAPDGWQPITKICPRSMQRTRSIPAARGCSGFCGCISAWHRYCPPAVPPLRHCKPRAPCRAAAAAKNGR